MTEELLDIGTSDGKLGNVEAVITIINTVVGVILLQVPFAMYLSGFLGALMLVVVTSVMGYTAYLIGLELDMLDHLADEQNVPVDGRDLGWIAFVAFGNKGKRLVSMLFGCELYLACISFLLLSATNIGTLCGISMRTAITFCALASASLQAFLALDPERCMKLLAYASSISVTSLAVTVLGLIVTGIIGASSSGLPTDDYTIFSAGLPKALGIMLFVFAGHPCMPQIYYAMSEPSDEYAPAVKRSFGAACVIYLTVGLGGYVLFGGAIAKNFVSNLARTDAGTDIAWMVWLRTFSQVALSIKIIATFPIVAEPVMNTIVTTSAYGPFVRVLQRLAFALITAFIAVGVEDQLETVSALAGGVFTMSTSVLFPCSAFLMLATNMPMSQKVTCWSCLVLGIIGLIFCLATSVIEVYGKKD